MNFKNWVSIELKHEIHIKVGKVAEIFFGFGARLPLNGFVTKQKKQE